MRSVATGKRLAVCSSFELCGGTLELKKNGVRLRLEEKPGRLLACLLDRTGGVVDRADLIEELWPEESHGDFDHRLNKAINKLRFVLGDDSADPRFIQTLSRRGYRFVGEVRVIEVGASPDVVSPAADIATGAIPPYTEGNRSSSGPTRIASIPELKGVRSAHCRYSGVLSRRAANPGGL